MADREVTFRLNFENEDMAKVFDQMLNSSNELQSDFRRLEKVQSEAFKEGAQAVEQMNKRLDENLKNLDQESTKLKAAKKNADGFGESMKGAAREISIFGVNLGDASDKLARLRTAFTATTTSVGGTTKALRVFKTALAATGIGAILIALGSLVALLTKTQRGVDFVNRVFAGLSATVSVIIDRLSGFGEGLVLLFQGKFGQAVEVFKESVSGIGAEIQTEISAAVELERRTQRLREETLKFRLEEAKLRSEIEQLRNAGEDATRTIQDRQKALQRAIDLENQLATRQTELAQENLAIIKEQNELGESLFEDREAEVEAAIQLAEIQGASASRQREDANKLRTLAAERVRQLEEQRQKAEELAQTLLDVTADSEIERNLEKQIAFFRELRESIVDAGLADQFADELAELDQLITFFSGRLTEGLFVEPLEELPGIIRGAIDGNETDFIEEGRRIAEKINAGLKEQLEALTPDQLAFLKDVFADVFDSIADIAITGTEIALQQQEQLINSREQAIGELESQLEAEERLQEQGLANNASRLRSGLQEERNILKREQERRLELEKRAARQRLVVDSLQQASQITLATAKLLNQGASGFIPGLLIAAGGIALLFRILAQAKANAASFSSPPQFREGTPSLDGPSHEAGGVLIEAEGGERILSKKMNDMLGGRQLSNEELVDFALAGMAKDSLFGMDAGEAITPMAAAIAAGAASASKVEAIQAWERNDVITKVLQREFAETRLHTEKMLKERPTYHRLDVTGVREYHKGGTKVIERIVPK